MNSFYNAPPDPPPPPAHGNPYIASADSFTTTLDGFAPYHQSSLNNLLHFFTVRPRTPHHMTAPLPRVPPPPPT